jgi:hypothetical protein
VKKGLNFVFAERVENVWKEALMPAVARPAARKQDDAEIKPEPLVSDRAEQR